MSKEHVRMGDAVDTVHDALIDATRAGAKDSHWMAAVWCVEGGQVKLVRRTTWQFPREEFLTTVAQLASVCVEENIRERETSRLLPDDPLPLAVLEDAGFNGMMRDVCETALRVAREDSAALAGTAALAGMAVNEQPAQRVVDRMQEDRRDAENS